MKNIGIVGYSKDMNHLRYSTQATILLLAFIQYDGLGEYYGLSTASEVFVITGTHYRLKYW